MFSALLRAEDNNGFRDVSNVECRTSNVECRYTHPGAVVNEEFDKWGISQVIIFKYGSECRSIFIVNV